MQYHAECLYAQIIEFTVRAMKRPALQALSAITSPFQLKFRDIVDDILETSCRIDRLALSMSQVKIHQMQRELTETRKVAEEIKAALESKSPRLRNSTPPC
jgi:mitochondrial fission protein ELM1